MKPPAADTHRVYSTEFETRADNAAAPLVAGYASVFGKPSQPLGWEGFIEYVDAGAFTKTIREADVAALFNHDTNIVLGRNRANPPTLRLSEDATGLRYEIDIDPENRSAHDVWRMILRGDVYQSSFGFDVVKEEWVFPDNEKDDVIRHIKEVRLWDVSPVTFPAYLDTTVEAASLVRSLARAAEMPVEVFAGASTGPEIRSRIIRHGILMPEPPAGTPLLDQARRNLDVYARSRR